MEMHLRLVIFLIGLLASLPTLAAFSPRTYDALNHVASETSNQRTSQYKYDLAGNRTRCLYGGTNRQIDSAYDSLNRLLTLTDGTRKTTYGYDLNGNVQKKTLPSGEYVLTNHDALNRTTMIQPKGFQFDQYFDLHGNLRKITEVYYNELTGLNRTVLNTYDKVDRLKKEEITGGGAAVTQYGYDAANNKTTKTLNGAVTTYLFNNLNQLTSFSGPASSGTYEYDSNGARTMGKVSTPEASGGVTTITLNNLYDRENRLAGVNKRRVFLMNGRGTAILQHYDYVYDYRTRRVSIQGTENTDTVFSGGTSVQEYTVSGTTQTLTVENIRGSDWGGGVGGILYTLRSGQASPSYTHYDGRGDVVSKSDDTKKTTYRATYEAFGTRTQEAGSTEDRQKANTKDEDPTGLLNEGMRYRDLETGTFITRDPMGFVDGPNLYAYVRQNPWTKFDPEGLSLKSFVVGVWEGAITNEINRAVAANEQGTMIGAAFQGPTEGSKTVAEHKAWAGKMDRQMGEMVEGNSKSFNVANDDDRQTGQKTGAIIDNNIDVLSASATVAVLNRKSPGAKPASEVQSETKQAVENVDPRNLVPRQGPSEMTGNKIKRYAKGMKENGFDASNPIEVANVDGRKIIIDGHHRTEAAKKAGLTSVPVKTTQVTPAQAEKLSQEASEAAGERESRRR